MTNRTPNSASNRRMLSSLFAIASVVWGAGGAICRSEVCSLLSSSAVFAVRILCELVASIRFSLGTRLTRAPSTQFDPVGSKYYRRDKLMIVASLFRFYS